MKEKIGLYVFLLLTVIASIAQRALAQGSSASPAGRAGAIVINTEVVSITVRITDKQGRNITGLDRSVFRVFEDGVAQEIVFFRSADDPASIGIVFDLSGSMKGEKIARAKEALARLVQSGHREDEYFLLAFNNRTQTLAERIQDGDAMIRALSNRTPGGNTALFDATAEALEQIRQGRWHNRALIIISDGEDNRSRVTLRKLRQLIREAGVTVYVVIIEENRLPRFVGADELRALAADSGGNAFTPGRPEQLADVFDQIAVELRQQYSIGYLPTNLNLDGKWRRVNVQIPPLPGLPKLSVRTRAGYFATAPRPASKEGTLADAKDER